MKRIILIVNLLFMFAGLSLAQTTTPKDARKAKTTAAKATTTAPKTAATAPKPATAVHTKKDGTPDMRYKENKEAAKPPVHTKKDGTPDMRYKENKKPAGKSTPATTPKKTS